MLNFDINVDRWTDGHMDRGTEKWMPMSQSQKDVLCKV